MSSRWQCRCRYRSVRASRSFSLSHLGPRNTHASAPDALLSSLYPSFPRSTHAACSFHPPKTPLVSLLSVLSFRIPALFSHFVSRRLHIFAVAGSLQGSDVSTRPPLFILSSFRSLKRVLELCLQTTYGCLSFYSFVAT